MINFLEKSILFSFSKRHIIKVKETDFHSWQPKMLLENVNQHFAYFCLLYNDNNYSSMSLLTFVKIDLASIDAMNGQSNIYLTQTEANRKRKRERVCVCVWERERERKSDNGHTYEHFFLHVHT